MKLYLTLSVIDCIYDTFPLFIPSLIDLSPLYMNSRAFIYVLICCAYLSVEKIKNLLIGNQDFGFAYGALFAIKLARNRGPRH